MAHWTEEELRILKEALPLVAQQLRAPMNNLALAAGRLLEDLPPEAQRNGAVIQQSYYRMLRLINHLDMAPQLLEATPLRRQNTDVVAWCEDLCAQAESLCRDKEITLSFRCELPCHVAAIHAGHMEKLFWNLLSNALKFTEKGGRITVTLKKAGTALLLSVDDTGCGIAPERMDTVFDRWLHTERMDPLPHGLGLGLPLCRSIAERHGGRLLLQSRPGEGTSVTVSVPDEQVAEDEIRDVTPEYSGGASPVLMEMSDALPYTAFLPEFLD